MQGPDRRSWLVPATVSLVLIPTAAGASGFALLEQSASRLGTAFAGTAAAADDATTVFFNPAGMTALSQPEAVVSASGIGVNAPFGLKLVYDDDWIGRFQALRSEISTLNINPSVAYQIGERFSIGAGVNFQRLDAELTNDVNYSAVIAQGVVRSARHTR